MGWVCEDCNVPVLSGPAPCPKCGKRLEIYDKRKKAHGRELSKEEADKVRKELFGDKKPVIDCGDNSCFFAPQKGGMRTNGGCRCFENAGFGRSATAAAHKMLPELVKLRADLKTATDALEEISKDEWEVISQSTGMRQSGPSASADIATTALAKIRGES